MNLKNVNLVTLFSRRKVFSLVISNCSKILSFPRNLLDEISQEGRIVVKKAKESVSREAYGGEE